MGFFSTKKPEEFRVAATKDQCILQVNEKGFNEKEPRNILCMIKQRNLLEVSGGSPPYVMSHCSLEGEPFQNLITEKGIQFQEGPITDLFFTAHLSQLLDILAKEIILGKMRIFLRDQKYQERYVDISINLQQIHERMKKAEKIECESILLEVNENKEIRVRFIPKLAITTLHHSPEILLSFEDKLGVKNQKLDTYYMEREETWGTYHFYSNGTRAEFTDEEKTRSAREGSGRGTLIVKTKGNLLLKNFSVDLTQAKRMINKIKTEEKDWRTFTEADLIAVHMTTKADWDKVVSTKLLGPRVLYATAWRPSIHVTLNHVVVPHGAAPEGWKNADTAILIPFKELKDLNKNKFYGGPTVDVSFLAYVKLPRSTVIIERAKAEAWENFVERINEKIRELGFRVMPGGEWGWSVERNWEAAEWLRKTAEIYEWPTTAPHFYTPIGKIENLIAQQSFDGKLLREMPVREANRLFRKVLLERIEQWEPELWAKYGIHLRAWSNFWEKRLK